MNAEIIAVGSELLLGQIANTNAQFFSQELAKLGIDVYYHTVVGDNHRRLAGAIEIACDRADIIIFSGGLGPTKDDLTKETVAESIGVRLVYDGKAMAHIRNYFKKTNRKMTLNNQKQALVFEGAKVLANTVGMAPGMALETEGKMFMLFPGPPRELQPMFLEDGKKYLQSRLQTREPIVSRVLRFFGIGESKLETEITDLIEAQTNPTIAPLAGFGEVTLRLTAKGKTTVEASRLIDELESKVLDRVGAYFYGYDETSLAKEAFKRLKSLSLTISCAESLTGGWFAKVLTDLPGASGIFKGGIICYTNDVKKNTLHIPKAMLENDGVVSEACAIALAENVRKGLASDIGISFTGVAGPDPIEEKRAGTVYIGLAREGRTTECFALTLAGGRSRIRNQAVSYGFFHLLHYLKKEI